ncbi:DUF3784 domain-containing protein [Clostridium perfringens]|nr:DUF3784 domain-containing protein [Clostridium perfringens]
MSYLTLEFLIGMLLCTLGHLVWIKKRTDLIHNYCIRGVKDIHEYCNCMGRCVFFLGVVLILLSLFGYLELLEIIITQIFIGVSIVIGFTVLIVSQKRLSGHIF